MKLTIKKLILLIVAAIFPAALFLSDAQTYVRYVKPEDFATKVVYADSVLTSIVLPRGISKLSSYPKFNAAAYELSQVLKDPDKQLLQVWVCGSSSPDGLWEYNVNLSKQRTEEAVAYLKQVMNIPDSLIHKESLNEDWDRLAELVAASDKEYKDEVVDIIHNKYWGDRKSDLQALEGGKVWRSLEKEFFPLLRCVRFAIYCKWDPSKPHLSAPKEVVTLRDTVTLKETVTIRDTVTLKETVTVRDTVTLQETVTLRDTVTLTETIYVRDTVVVVKEPESVEVAPVIEAKEEKFWLKPHIMAIKTNLLSDAMAIPSLGIEVQLYKGLTLDVSGAYGFFNIFNKSNRDMEMWNVSPELRLWFGDHPMQKGRFIGLHANVSNFSLQWRDGVAYQAIPGQPAWSAGFTYGACARMGKKSHFGLEFVIGVGYGQYHQNVGTIDPAGSFIPNESVSPQVRHHFGLTKLAVNLVYRFSMAKKK